MTTVVANGKRFTFAAGTTPEQIEEAIDHHFKMSSPNPMPDASMATGNTGANPAPADPQAQGPDFWDRTGERFDDAVEGSIERFRDFDPLSMDMHPGVAAVGGEMLPAAYETATDALLTAGKKVLPEEATDWIGSKAAEVMASKPMQAITGAIEDFSEEYPEIADRVNVGVNIAGAVPGPRITIPQAKRAIDKRIRRNKDAIKDSRLDKTKDILIPEGKDVPGDWDIDEWGNKVYKATDFEQEVADTITGLPEFNPNKSVIHNNAGLAKAIEKERKRLDKSIKDKGDPRIDMERLDKGFEDALLSLQDEVFNDAAAQQTITRAIEKMRQQMKSDKASDVLQARRDFDNLIRKEMGEGIFNPERQSAGNKAMNIVRRAVNEEVDKSVKGVDVTGSLRKQHHMLHAKAILKEKAAKAAHTKVGRTIKAIESKLGMKFPTTPLAAGATVGAAGSMIAGQPVLAGVVGGGLAGVGAYKGGKWLFSAAGRNWLLKMTRAVADNPMLGAEKAILVDLYNELTKFPVEEDNESI